MLKPRCLAFASRNRVLVYDRIAFTVLAGQLKAGYRDGIASEALFSTIRGLCVSNDLKTLFVSDSGNYCLRSINLATMSVTRLAGGALGPQTSPFSASQSWSPGGICMRPDDSIIIADTENNVIRRLSLPHDANAPVLAGDGVPENFSGFLDSASFCQPSSVHNDVNGDILVVCAPDHTNQPSLARIDSEGIVSFTALQLGPMEDIKVDSSHPLAGVSSTRVIIDAIPFPIAHTNILVQCTSDSPHPRSAVFAIDMNDHSNVLASVVPNGQGKIPRTPSKKNSASSSAPVFDAKSRHAPPAPPLPTTTQFENVRSCTLGASSASATREVDGEVSSTIAFNASPQTSLYALTILREFLDMVIEALSVHTLESMHGPIARKLLKLKDEETYLPLVVESFCFSKANSKDFADPICNHPLDTPLAHLRLVAPRSSVGSLLLDSSESTFDYKEVTMVDPNGVEVKPTELVHEVLSAAWSQSSGRVPLFTLAYKNQTTLLRTGDYSESLRTNVVGLTRKKLIDAICALFKLSRPLHLHFRRTKHVIYDASSSKVLRCMFGVPSTRTYSVTHPTHPTPLDVNISTESSFDEAAAKMSFLTQYGSSLRDTRIIINGKSVPRFLPISTWPQERSVTLGHFDSFIYCKTLMGDTYALDFNRNDTVEMLKFQVHLIDDIPPADQRAMFDGRQIYDDRKLSDYCIRRGSTLEIQRILRGG